jgi:hypothetical protein
MEQLAKYDSDLIASALRINSSAAAENSFPQRQAEYQSKA